MDFQSLSNVLETLRRINKEPPNRTGIQIIAKWADTNDPGTVLRIAGHIQDQVRSAQTVIENSKLPPEGKLGMKQTLDGIQIALSIKGLANSTRQAIPNLTGSISNLVFLLTTSGFDVENIEPPKEAVDLAAEVDQLASAFDDEALDPVIRDIAKRHLATLSTLLRHLPVFGLEAALAMYFEMVIRLRRAEANTSEESKKAAKPLFERIESWRKRFETIDKMWNIGVRWVGAAKSVGALLLSYIPGSGS